MSLPSPTAPGADPTAHAAAVPILMYHSIAEDADRLDRPFTVRPAQLAEHVAALTEWGARPLTVDRYASALRQGRPLPARTVVVTVDDGYADTADVLAPLLTAAGLTATVFVTTGVIGGTVRASRMIDWPRLHALAAAGFEIGGHAHHHIALDIVRPAVALEEMVRSRLVLEEGLGAPVRTFAYPHGYWTPTLTRLAPQAGYRAACAARNGLSGPGDDLFALARVVVGRTMTAERLLDVVQGVTVGIPSSDRVLPRAAWRLARRTVRLAQRPAAHRRSTP